MTGEREREKCFSLPECKFASTLAFSSSSGSPHTPLSLKPTIVRVKARYVLVRAAFKDGRCEAVPEGELAGQLRLALARIGGEAGTARAAGALAVRHFDAVAGVAILRVGLDVLKEVTVEAEVAWGAERKRERVAAAAAVGHSALRAWRKRRHNSRPPSSSLSHNSTHPCSPSLSPVPPRPAARHRGLSPGRRPDHPARVRPPVVGAVRGDQGGGGRPPRRPGPNQAARGSGRQAGGCGAVETRGLRGRERERDLERETGERKLQSAFFFVSPSKKRSSLSPSLPIMPPPPDPPIFAATLPLTCVSCSVDVATAVAGGGSSAVPSKRPLHPTSAWAVRVEAADGPVPASSSSALWITASPPGNPLTVLGVRVDVAGYEKLRVVQARADKERGGELTPRARGRSSPPPSLFFPTPLLFSPPLITGYPRLL